MSELTRCSGIRSHALEWSCTDVHLEMVRYYSVYSQAKMLVCDSAFIYIKKKLVNFKHKHDIIKHCTVLIDFQSQFFISFLPLSNFEVFRTLSTFFSIWNWP